MSWLYVPGLEASNSDSNLPSQPLAQSVTWRGKPSPPLSRSPVFRKVISTMLQYGAMSNPSTARRGVEKWIASLAATRASRSVSRAVEKGRTIPDTSGPISGESSLKSNPGSASLKTWQDIFHLDLNQYGETFADWVTRLKQDSLRRQKLGRHINDSGSLSWPTPNVPNGGRTMTPEDIANKGSTAQGKRQVGLSNVARMWPTARSSDQYGAGQHGEGGMDLRTQASVWGTPRSTDYKGAGQVGDKAHTHRLKHHYLDAQALMVPYGPQTETMPTGGTTYDNVARDLNPRFVEWLMGFPIGWTALQPLETASYQQWQQQHGAR
jgi:hypothetical protein